MAKISISNLHTAGYQFQEIQGLTDVQATLVQGGDNPGMGDYGPGWSGGTGTIFTSDSTTHIWIGSGGAGGEWTYYLNGDYSIVTYY